MPTVRKRRSHKQKTGRTKSSRRQQDKLKKIIVQGPPALVKEWDVKLTAAQNYERLGLHLKRPMALRQSGGVEKLHPAASRRPSGTASTSKKTLDDEDEDDEGDDMSEDDEDEEGASPREEQPQPPTLTSRDIPKGFARIERDAQGNVLRVIMSAWDNDGQDGEGAEGDEQQGESNKVATTTTPWGAPLTNEEDEKRLQALAQPVQAKNQAIRDLEARSLSEKSIPAASLRFTSPAERAFLMALYEKYGDDVPAMAKDIKLNRDQRTTGQLRRMFAKAGGLENFAKAQQA